MSIRIGINGFGRMGRLALRAAWDWPELEIVHINEIDGNAHSAAHLLQFDSIHGQWRHPVEGAAGGITIGDRSIGDRSIGDKTIVWTQHQAIEDTPWDESRVDIAIDCSGRFKSKQLLAPYFDRGVKKVVVSAPVKDGTLNIVMGVNDHLYRAEHHDIVTAASCTTNCIAPVVDVIHNSFGIVHGSLTTIHDITNTQSILDQYHKDLRRARASSLSLIPTSTGSATAIAEIFPELKGRLNGVAVRVPLANASLTDCVFEVGQAVTVEEVNEALKQASTGRLAGILGYEERPLVSVDYVNDTRSGIVDAPCTMVIDGTQVKILIWYDNEIGYVHRMMELAVKLAADL